jgi:hypothetical protein
MWKRLSGAGLILFVLICAACSRKGAPSSTQPTQPSDRYVESVNTVSGTFPIDAGFNEDKQPSVIDISQAYARVVTSLEDENKKDVLIVLLEQPLSRGALAVIEGDELKRAAALDEMLRNRDARGVVLRVPTDRNAGQDKIRPFFNGKDFDFGNLQLELKSLSGDKAEGHIKSNVAAQQTDITFAVKLQPDVWTGGTFYQLPPTKLSPGQASGQIEIDDRVVKLNHAYARLMDLDLFDETKNVFEVWLSEKPLGREVIDQAGFPPDAGNVILRYRTTGPEDRSELTASPGTRIDFLPGVERDYVRHGSDAIEGRLFSIFLVEVRDRAYKMDLLFNATMLPATASDGPVTTSQGGEPLPADGGEPAKAYRAAMERMKGVKNFDEGISAWLSVVTKDAAERIKRDVQSVSQVQRQLLVDVFAPLENPQLTGGLIKDNKATLRLTGTAKGQKAEEAVNLHLEDGQWKIGRREIRVD